MRELLSTNDPVLLSYVETLLRAEGIGSAVFDGHMSLVEGSIGAFPRRLMVAEDDWRKVTVLMADAGLSEWVKTDDAD